jgi:glycosyltransferase involved in cell wall biosynthesis
MTDANRQSRAKVCVLTTVHVPFDGRIFHKEAKSLAKAGYDVVLIARHDKAETIDGVRLVPLPQPRNRFHRMTAVTWRLYRLAVREDADVYHFHDPELMIVGLLLKARGKKVIWDVHEHYPNSIMDKFWISKSLRRCVSKSFDLFERAVVRFFDRVVYTTPFVGARYQKLKVESVRIENYPIVELSETFQRDPQKRIIYLGVMSRIRGLLEVIEAFAMVVAKHPDWRLVLAGQTSPASFEDELRALVTERGIESNVDFIAWVPYEEKERLSSQASMGVITYLPYSNNTSCLPNKLFDYMLVGLPVVASNFPLYKEVVEPSRCGLIVDPASPREVAEAMLYLVEHPDEARAMGERGLAAVRQRYNWEHESDKLCQMYETLLGTAGGQERVKDTVDRRGPAQLHEDGAAVFRTDAGRRV